MAALRFSAALKTGSPMIITFFLMIESLDEDILRRLFSCTEDKFPGRYYSH